RPEGGRALQWQAKEFETLLILERVTSTVQRKSCEPWPLFWLAAAGALAGCLPPPPPSSAPIGVRFPDVTLTVACPPAARPILDGYDKGWQNRTGARVQILSSDAASGPPPGADLWIITPAELPAHAAAGRLQGVPESLTGSDTYAWGKLLPDYQDKLLTWG